MIREAEVKTSVATSTELVSGVAARSCPCPAASAATFLKLKVDITRV